MTAKSSMKVAAIGPNSAATGTMQGNYHVSSEIILKGRLNGQNCFRTLLVNWFKERRTGVNLYSKVILDHIVLARSPFQLPCTTFNSKTTVHNLLSVNMLSTHDNNSQSIALH